jgi:arsenite-transporting ATPase
VARIIFISGKGGVGKTTIAAATGLAAARHGHRTLVLSLDLAHSLADAFDVNVPIANSKQNGTPLFNKKRGLPFSVADNLDLQEIDVQEEIERNWQEIFRYIASVMSSTGLDDIVAEELAIVPGTEDIIALAYLNRYVRDGVYDVIVLDAPPTADSLGFVNVYATLEWYMRKRFRVDRQLARVAGPLLQRLTDVPAPRDSVFASLERLFRDLERTDALLADPAITTVRLVTNPEKMVVRETKRAYLYFCLYGLTTDQVIVNRLVPDGPGFFARRAATQATYLEEIRAHFAPVPVATVPMFPDEVLGEACLRELAEILYPDQDPTQTLVSTPPYRFQRDNGGYSVQLALPFVEGPEVEVIRTEEDLVVRVGSFKRYVHIPRPVRHLPVANRSLRNGQLVVRFAK